MQTAAYSDVQYVKPSYTSHLSGYFLSLKGGVQKSVSHIITLKSNCPLCPEYCREAKN